MSMSNHDAKLLRTISAVTIITIMSKIIALIRSMITTHIYGTTPEAVAFDAAFQIPALFFDFLIGGVIVSAFTPLFIKRMNHNNKDECYTFAKKYLTFLIFMTANLSIILEITAPLIIPIIVPGLNQNTLQLTIILTRIMLPMLMLAGITYFFIALLQSLDKFYIPAAISILSSLAIISYLIFLSDKFGIIGLAIANIIGWLLQIIIQIPTLIRLRFIYKPALPSKSELKEITKTGIPMLIACWSQPLCNIINTGFASYIDEGKGITSLSISYKLFIVISGLLIYSITNVIYPKISKNKFNNNPSNNIINMPNILKYLSILVFFISSWLYFNASNIIKILYEYGAFEAQDTTRTAEIFQVLAISIIPFVLIELTSKILYANNKILLPAVTSVISIVLNIIICTIFIKKNSMYFIAIAILVSQTIQCLINLSYTIKLQLFTMNKQDCIQILASFTVSIILYFTCYFTPLTKTSTFACIAETSIIYGISACIICFLFFKHKEVKK